MANLPNGSTYPMAQLYITSEIAEEKFGFLNGKGTTDAILTLRNIIEKTTKRQDGQIWIMFVDYATVFDTVHHNTLWKTLVEFGVPQRQVWLVEKLYSRAAGVIRVDGTRTNSFRFEKDVRQGCILSPMLFNICGEKIMRSVKGTTRLCHRRLGCVKFTLRR